MNRRTGGRFAMKTINLLGYNYQQRERLLQEVLILGRLHHPNIVKLYEVFQTDKDIDDSFLWIWFKSSNFFNWINKLQEGSVRQYFYYDKLCECKLPVPSLKEQEKIGTFFSKLDNLITLHQRQYEQLVSLKKYLLSKMFI